MKKLFILFAIIYFILVSNCVYYIKKDARIDRIKFYPVNNPEKIENDFLEINTDVVYFVKNEESFYAQFKFNGKYYLFFTFKAESLNKKPLKVKIFLERRNSSKILLRKYRGKNLYKSFEHLLKLKSGDRLIVKVNGEGKIGFNKVVIQKFNPSYKKFQYVFLIALDTLRYDVINRKHYGKIITPHLNSFIKDSVVFQNAYAQSNWTLPSFSSLFTGIYEYKLRMSKFSSIPKYYKQFTFYLKKRFFLVNFNANLWVGGKYGFSRNFDFFRTISLPDDNRGGKKLFANAIKTINRIKFRNIFFFLHTYQIHSPYNPPQEFAKDLFPELPFYNLDSFFYRKQFNRNVPHEKILNMKKLYLAEINAFDSYFGEFIKYLKKKQIYKKSLIVFLSDHGEEFYEHKGWAHSHSLYNEVMKVPLVIKFPDNKYGGKIINKNVNLFGVFPTILDYLEISYEKDKIDAKSFLDIIREENKKEQLVVSSNIYTRLVPNIPPKFSIVKGRYKLIFNAPYSDKDIDYFSKYGTPPVEKQIMIFDLVSDPLEKVPIEGKEKMRILKMFKKEVNKIRREVKRAEKLSINKKVNISSEEIKRLKSLGYID